LKLPMPSEEKPNKEVWRLGLIRTHYAENCQTVSGFRNTCSTCSTPRISLLGWPSDHGEQSRTHCDGGTLGAATGYFDEELSFDAVVTGLPIAKVNDAIAVR